MPNKFRQNLTLGYRGDQPVEVPIDSVGHLYGCGKTGSGKSFLLNFLARQLIRSWSYRPFSMLLVDPHSSLYDSLLKWLAASGLDHLPVVPFDLRSDWICSLNILRPRPGCDPAPITHGNVRAILNGWQQTDSTFTPRLTKVLSAILHVLYDAQCTLFETLDVIRSPEIRRAMGREVEDALAKSVFTVWGSMKEAEFQEQCESTLNRLGRFLSTKVLQLAFSQSGASLDMRAALDKGQIVLASLSTEGSRIAAEDAAVVGSLLVNEVAAAANDRGKRDNLLHHYMLIDEFQLYISPTIAQSLAQLRGMGISLFAFHQSPQQLLDLGPIGRQVLNAVLSNASTQVIFQTAHPDDLEILTPYLYRGSVNPDAIKFRGTSTRVLGHKIQYMTSTNSSTTRGTSQESNWSHAESASDTHGASMSRGVSKGNSHSSQHVHSVGVNVGTSVGRGSSSAESEATSEARGTTESSAAARNRQLSTARSESRHVDTDYDTLAKIVGPKPTTNFNEVFKDEDENYRHVKKTIDKSESDSDSEGTSESEGMAITQSTSSARAKQMAESQSRSESRGSSESRSHGNVESKSLQLSESETESVSTTSATSETVGGGRSISQSASTGSSRSPMLIPILGEELLPPQFRSVEEQLFIFSQFLASQPKRHAVVKTDLRPPRQIVVPILAPPNITDEGARAWATYKLKKLDFAMTLDEAMRRLDARRKLFEQKYLGTLSTDEPPTTARRIKG